jgi:hypothetical protein
MNSRYDQSAESAKLYAFFKYQYMRRGALNELWKMFDFEDNRTPGDLLKELGDNKFQIGETWMCQRAAQAVFPVGQHRVFEHTFHYVTLHEEYDMPDGHEVCVVDFSKDISLIQKEIELLWQRKNSGIKNTDHNAIEQMRCGWTKTPSTDCAPRLAGLWLWDRVQALGGENSRGAVANAIREFTDGRFDLSTLESKEDREFRAYFRWTKRCVEEGEVLPFSNRKR